MCSMISSTSWRRNENDHLRSVNLVLPRGMSDEEVRPHPCTSVTPDSPRQPACISMAVHDFERQGEKRCDRFQILRA